MLLACSPRHLGGSETHAPGTTVQSVVSRLYLQRETCTNGHGKTTSMIPLIILVFGEFSSPVIASDSLAFGWRFGRFICRHWGAWSFCQKPGILKKRCTKTPSFRWAKLKPGKSTDSKANVLHSFQSGAHPHVLVEGLLSDKLRRFFCFLREVTLGWMIFLARPSTEVSHGFSEKTTWTSRRSMPTIAIRPSFDFPVSYTVEEPHRLYFLKKTWPPSPLFAEKLAVADLLTMEKTWNEGDDPNAQKQFSLIASDSLAFGWSFRRFICKHWGAWSFY